MILNIASILCEAFVLPTTLRAETCAKLLTKTFAFGQICHKFRGKNFREFCVKLIFTWRNGATVGHLPKKLSRLKDIRDFAWKNFRVLMVYNFQRQKLRENDQKTRKTRNLMPAKVSTLTAFVCNLNWKILYKNSFSVNTNRYLLSL